MMIKMKREPGAADRKRSIKLLSIKFLFDYKHFLRNKLRQMYFQTSNLHLKQGIYG